MSASGQQRAADELPTQGRLIAVDLGEVRVGIAVSDPGQVVASPAETLHVPRGDDKPLVEALCDAARRHEAVGIVVGHPKQLDGRDGPAGQRARRVAERLRERSELVVVLWDERFTTVEAERVLLDADLSRSDRKDTIDRVAASVLLQGVLESRRRGRAV